MTLSYLNLLSIPHHSPLMIPINLIISTYVGQLIPVAKSKQKKKKKKLGGDLSTSRTVSQLNWWIKIKLCDSYMWQL